MRGSESQRGEGGGGRVEQAHLLLSIENPKPPAHASLPAFCIVAVSRYHDHDSVASPGQRFWQGAHHISQAACILIVSIVSGCCSHAGAGWMGSCLLHG